MPNDEDLFNSMNWIGATAGEEEKKKRTKFLYLSLAAIGR